MYSLTIVITKENCKQILKFQTYDVEHFLLNSETKKIILLFPEMRVMRKNFIRAAANLFFQAIFRKYSLFFITFDTFFDSCLFVVCCFLKWKMYILIHIRLCGWVSDKNIFTRPISENKTLFFWPDVKKPEMRSSKI